MSKHTPGPWRYEESTKTIRSVPKNDWIASMGSWDGSVPTAANARLIAAAPELLEALRAVVDDFGVCPHCQGKCKIPGSRNWVSTSYVEADCWHCGASGKSVNLPWMKAALAVIAKALGND